MESIAAVGLPIYLCLTLMLTLDNLVCENRAAYRKRDVVASGLLRFLWFVKRRYGEVPRNNWYINTLIL